MKWSIGLALLSGVLYVFSFAPWDLAHLQWFAFLPLFFAVEPSRGTPPAFFEGRSWLWIFTLGLIPSMVITFGGFYWMVHATQQYGGLPLGAACSLLVVFSLVNQMQIPIYLCLRRFFLESMDWNTASAGKLFLAAGAGAAAYCGIESLYPKLFLDTAGHAFYHAPWVRQWADIGGPFGITFLILACNELLYLGLRTRRAALGAALGAGAFLIPAYGAFRVHQFHSLPRTPSEEIFRLALVQANIGDYLKLAAERGSSEAGEEVMDRYLRLSTAAASGSPPPDAVVWPETAYPAIFGQPKTHLESRMDARLSGHLRETQTPHLFGGYDANTHSEEFNSLFFYDPRIGTPAVYHKSILLMFGETLPFAEAFPAMKSWFPTMGFFGRGPGPQVFEVRNRAGTPFQFAPSICYEGLFSDFAAAGALQGADALLNVTNDSWFGPYGEPYLHLALTQFRAIETRLPLIRSTNTGISVLVDPIGETRISSGIGTEEWLEGEISKIKMPKSPYLRMSEWFGGNWFPRACQLLTVLLLLGLRSKRYRPA